MAQDLLLLSDGVSRLLLSDGVSRLQLSTTSGAAPDADTAPYARAYKTDHRAGYLTDNRRTYKE